MTPNKYKKIIMVGLIEVGCAAGITYEIVIDCENQHFVSQIHATNTAYRRTEKLYQRVQTLRGSPFRDRDIDPKYNGPRLSDLYRKPPFTNIDPVRLLDSNSEESKRYRGVYNELEKISSELDSCLSNKGIEETVKEIDRSQGRSFFGGILIGIYSLLLIRCLGYPYFRYKIHSVP